jgi:hypothetical protein
MAWDSTFDSIVSKGDVKAAEAYLSSHPSLGLDVKAVSGVYISVYLRIALCVHIHRRVSLRIQCAEARTHLTLLTLKHVCFRR